MYLMTGNVENVLHIYPDIFGIMTGKLNAHPLVLLS